MLSSEVDGVVATATNIVTTCPAVEGDITTIEQQYTVGLDANGTFTGFEVLMERIKILLS